METSKFTVDPIGNETALIDRMTQPIPEVQEAVSGIGGEVMILGIAGKMGLTLGELLVRSGARGVIGVSRFSNPADRNYLEARGIRTVRCDLIDDNALRGLPDAGHIILLAGHKFGSTGNEPLTWAMNALLPGKVMQRFPDARIVYVSSGNVYRFVSPDTGGAVESSALDPIGEYAQSRLGGERLAAYYAERNDTPLAVIRLFYATELRYGVFLDIAQRVWSEQPIDLSMGYVNQIWQGDANAYLARSFPLCESPARVLNLTGPDLLHVRDVALKLGALMGREPAFAGEERPTALLGNSRALFDLMGLPRTSSDEMMEWVAAWVMNAGPTLGKPTKYEARNGQF
jgi:nucleoside-diphosphate-sugar epimerase